jgi:putative membrane protein
MMPMWNGWGFGMVLMVSFWVLLIACIIFAVRWAVHQRRALPSGRDSDAPLEILKRRYARGELDTNEFERMKRDLL